MSGISWDQWLKGLHEHLAEDDRGLGWANKLKNTLSFGRTVDRERLEAEVPPMLAKIEDWDAPMTVLRSDQLARLFALAPGAPLGYRSSAGGLTDEDLEEVLEEPAIASLVELVLEHNELTDRGVRAVAGCPRLGKLERLRIEQEPEVGDPSAIAVAESTILTNLRHLSLKGTAVGDEGAIALAGSPTLSKLETLSLRETKVGEPGRTALASSEHLSAEIEC